MLTMKFIQVLELRDPALPLSAASLGGMGLLLDGCPAAGSGAGASLSVANGTATLSIPSPAAANGYFLVTAAGGAGEDPVRWKVQASADGGATWGDVGASAWRSGPDGNRIYYPQVIKECTYLCFQRDCLRGCDGNGRACAFATGYVRIQTYACTRAHILAGS